MSDPLERRLLAAFAAELSAGARELETALFGIEREPDALASHVESGLRTTHRLKGAARSVGLASVERACDAAEALLRRAREQRVAPGTAEIDALLGLVPVLEAVAARVAAGASVTTELHDALVAFASGRSAQAPVTPASSAAPIAEVRPELADAMTRPLEGLVAARERARQRASEAADQLDALRQLARTLDAAREQQRTPALDRASAECARALRAATRTSSALVRDHAELARSLASLTDVARGLRTAPVEQAFGGLARQVRTLGRELGRAATLELDAAGAELDRTLQAPLRALLVQLVRNAIAHGIETPEERRAVGKPPEGTIRVTARASGDELVVTVRDDGRGIDRAALRRSVVRAGLPVPDTDAELLAQIFRAGITTAPAATDVAGTGVGLDVVARTVEDAGGHVSVRSEPGQGAEVVVHLPVTTGVVRGLVIEAGGGTYAIPASSVARVVRVAARDVVRAVGSDAVALAEGTLRIAPLATLIRAPELERAETTRTTLLLRAGDRSGLVAVDAITGFAELVARPLGPRLAGAAPYVGAAVLTDGGLAPVLSAAALLSRLEHGAASAPASRSVPRRLRVLLAEDSITTRTLEQSILEAAGYEVLPAADGREALRILAHAERIDAVVTDVQMSPMDGLELTAAIRRSERHPHVPIVLVTGLASDDDRARGVTAGASAYVVKRDFEQEALLDTLRRLIEESSS